MNWRLTVRLFTRAPNWTRELAGYTYQLDGLSEVGGLVDMAARSGEIVYVLLEPRLGLLQRFNDEHHGYRGKRKAHAVLP